MLSNSLIIIPTKEKDYQICDYVQQTAQILKDNNTVLIIFVNYAKSITTIIKHLLKKESSSRILVNNNKIYYYYPLALIPLQRFYFIRKINTILNILAIQIYISLKPTHYHRKILWQFFPELAYLNKYVSTQFIKLYDIVDFYTSPIPKINQWLINQKKHLLQSSEIVTSISKALRKQHASIYAVPIHLVPQGFREQAFTQYALSSNRPSKPRHPNIGFCGSLSERLDLDLLEQCIDQNPHYQFTFAGPIIHDNTVSALDKTSRIHQIISKPNVQYLGIKPASQIAEVIAKFDIGIIPYDTNLEFNKYCYPMKIFEYFYMGKPVIATPILELKTFPQYVKIGKTIKQWNQHLTNLTKTAWPTELKHAQRELAMKNSWNSKIRHISTHIMNYEISHKKSASF